ncbi:MAG: carbohydrate ABC transporter permease [Nocardioides sp.]|uniref:carbohydrate ABC transporter permease n=1 Tax=Nocardioides sp. TaxID=35761 RepID=UPI0039E55550
MTDSSLSMTQPRRRAASGRRTSGSNLWTHVFLIVLAVIWLVPLLWTLYTALRPYSETSKHGYFSFDGHLSLHNFTDAWSQGGFATSFKNSAMITIPAVIITVVLASLVAFAVSRFSWRFNITLLILYTAGNLLPPQVLAAPVFQLFKHLSLPMSISDSGTGLNTYYAVIAINVAFQLGFCTFVLSNFMKTLPTELDEAARLDGAGVWRQYWQIVLPLCRPALAALATLEFIWVYNDYFWALLLIQSGDRLPVTTAINNLQGQFVSNDNLIAAGATITVLPTLIIYAVLQRQFVAGLSLGSTKG